MPMLIAVSTRRTWLPRTKSIATSEAPPPVGLIVRVPVMLKSRSISSVMSPAAKTPARGSIVMLLIVFIGFMPWRTV